METESSRERRQHPGAPQLRSGSERPRRPTPSTAASRRKAERVNGEANKPAAPGEKPSKFLYGGVAMIALFKDMLDLVIGPLLGLVTVIALCCSILIGLLLFTFDRSGGGANKKMAQGLVLVLVTLVEGVGIGLDYLPLETASVILMYFMALAAWRKTQGQPPGNGAVKFIAKKLWPA